MRHLFFYLLLTAFATGCCNRCTEDSLSTRFHDDGRAKPIVALSSMIDTASFDVPWSISDEFTSTIHRMVAETGQVFIQTQDDFAFAANPFTEDLGWIKREFQNHEFVVFLELVEHDLETVKTSAELGPSYSLKTGVRVRVIDIRGGEPKIVLQQMIRDSYFIPRSYFPTDYEEITWGSAEYKKSALAIAHQQISRTIANRISEYVLLAKSR